MIVAAKQYSFQFISDGVSTAFVVDLTLPPNSQNFNGKLPSAVVLLSYSNTQSVTQPALSSVTLQGTTLTFNFASAPPNVDGNGNIVVYTATFTLEF